MFDILIAIINLFFVPFISVLIINKHRKNGYSAPFKCVTEWGVLLVANYVITKYILMAIKLMISKVVPPESTYYTITAIIVAVVLGYIFVIFSKHSSLRLSVGSDDTARETGHRDEETK